MMQKTYSMKASEVEKKWYIVDVKDKILGRVATEIASIIKGKTKPNYTPNLDMGDNVIVINADKVVLTGRKSENKEYFSHSQYPGGIKLTNIKKYMETKPEFIVEHAVKGMLPKGRLGSEMFKNLKVYAGTEHPHKAQKPEKIDL